MRVAAYQGPARGVDKAGALSCMAQAAADAAKDGTGLLVLPEMFLTGYNIGADAARSLAEPVDGPAAAAAADIARRCGVALLYGYPERGADAHIYNAALLIGGDGRRLANYRKSHLFGTAEREAFTPGDGPCVLAKINGMSVGILICYDVEFPETVRTLALRGADIVAVPTALMRPYEFVPRVLVRARAYESQVFLIYANRTGREGDLEYTGESCIVGPDGRDLARAGAGEQIISAALEPDLLAGSRERNPFLRDRRPDQYGGLA